MLTLREAALKSAIKFGVTQRDRLPVTIRRELRAMDIAIMMDMTGYGYYHYFSLNQSIVFSVGWNRGQWTFSMRRPSFGPGIETVRIRAGIRNICQQLQHRFG